MQTGICFAFGYTLPVAKKIKAIAAAGFQNTAFWWGNQYSDDLDIPRDRIPDLIRSAGLKLENVHADYEHINLLWEDRLESEDVWNQYRAVLDACHTHEIPAMVLHLTCGKNPPGPNPLGLDRIRRLVEHAERRNVVVAVENTRSPQHLDWIFSEIPSDHLKFCYDSGHENCFAPGANFLDLYGDRLAALHLHDNNGLSDQHLLPGKGTIDWPALTQKLKQHPYTGSLTLETLCPTPDQSTPDTFLAKAQQIAQSLAQSL